jgi:hypothetical protein
LDPRQPPQTDRAAWGNPGLARAPPTDRPSPTPRQDLPRKRRAIRDERFIGELKTVQYSS